MLEKWIMFLDMIDENNINEGIETMKKLIKDLQAIAEQMAPTITGWNIDYHRGMAYAEYADKPLGCVVGIDLQHGSIVDAMPEPGPVDIERENVVLNAMNEQPDY